jgi:hypothetical protein
VLPFIWAVVAGRSPHAHAQEPESHVAGMLQTELGWHQKDDSLTVTNPQHSGFQLRRARLQANSAFDTGPVTFFAQVEADLSPQFVLLDAFVSASGALRGDGSWQVAVGQHLTPFSRETFTPIWKLQFQTPAQLTTLTPGRQLGATVQLAVPHASWLELAFGLYNGDGINTPQNLDDKLMYVGRVGFRPLGRFVGWIGPPGTPSESALGPTYLQIAVNAMYNDRGLGDYDEKTLQLGGDATLAWRGLSVYAEYLWGRITYTAGAPKQDYQQHGAIIQAGYLLPIPGFLYQRFEVAFRFEAVAPNTIVPIEAAGDPTQARASYTPQISYYHFGHALKASVAYTHNQELDAVDRQGRKASYANDSLILQLAGRFIL